MTLTVHTELIQGSDEWLAARLGMVTASVVGQLVTPTLKVAANDTSRGLTATLVAERITGHIDPVYVSDDMLRGTMDEPIARDLYSRYNMPVAEVGFIVRDEPGWRLGFSPDGLVGEDGLIEIKSRRQKKQLQTILADQVPAENMAQIQAGLLVTGREWCDYVSFSGGMPLWVKRVHADATWHTALIDAVKSFELTASQMLADWQAVVGGLPPTERVDHFAEIRF